MGTKKTGILLFLLPALITAFYSCVDIVSDSANPFEVAQGSYASDQRTVGMTIISRPNKQVYELGDEPDWTGLEIMEAYSGGGAGIKTDYHSYDISGFDSSSPGQKTISVGKNGLSATFAVAVNSPAPPETVLVSLFIYSWPNKQVYEIGEYADWSGLTVLEYYSNGLTRVDYYYNYEINGFDSSTPGQKTISIGKNDLSAAFTVMVYSSSSAPMEAYLVSLSISSPPNKVAYEIGESADWTGMTVTGTYSDGSSSAEADYSIGGFNSSSSGVKAVTVSKNGVSASFTVTVNPAVLVSLSISTPPSKVVYEIGESANWTGLTVTGTYSDGSSRTESDYNIDGFNSSSSGVKTIVVAKNSISASFTVTVNPAVLVSL
jgi:hypothetical protein